MVPRCTALEKSIIFEPVGIRIPNSPVWIDSRRSRGLCIISHAHGDHVSTHERTIATPTTLGLLGLSGRSGAIPCPLRQPFDLGDVRIELIPAGHLPGSAQVLVEREGVRVLYSADIYDQPQVFSEPLTTAHCDLLVLESTYGTPAHSFPTREEAAEQLRREVNEVLAGGGTPLVLVEGSLGRAQEILVELSKDGHPLVASRSVARWNNTYRNLGFEVADCRPYAGSPARGSVLVFPMKSRGLRGLSMIRGVVKIACSGQAASAVNQRRLGVDRLVPFVDHADFEALLSIVERSRAKKILTVHGYTENLAKELRERGFDAQPLAGQPQLSFDF